MRRQASHEEAPSRSSSPTCDLGGEGAARDVLVIVLDQDAVVAWQGGQVGHCARPVFVVNAADFGLRGPLDSQVQTSCEWEQGARVTTASLFP